MEENQTIQSQTIDQTSHDDFDWSVDKRNVASYKKEDREKFDAIYDSTFKSIEESELLQGTIVGVTKTDVIINIGFKSDGLVSLNEFRDMPIEQFRLLEIERMAGFRKHRETRP